MTPGASIVCPALTLQFMPLREDLYPANAEYVDPAVQLHRHVGLRGAFGDRQSPLRGAAQCARADCYEGIVHTPLASSNSTSPLAAQPRAASAARRHHRPSTLAAALEWPGIRVTE